MRHPGRAEDVTLHDVFIWQPIHFLKYGARKYRVRIAVLVPPNTVPRLDERQEGFHGRRRGTSALVRRRLQIIRQARNVLNQLVDGWRRLRICEESIDLVAALKPAGLLAHENGARGDWLGQRGDAIARIAGRRESRSNLSASFFENCLPVLADGYRACAAARHRKSVECRREGRLQVNRSSRGCRGLLVCTRANQ